MTDDEKQKREEILSFLLVWGAEQPGNPYWEQNNNEEDPVLRAINYFPPVSLH